MHAGANTIHLFQFHDLSDRVFAVILHHPTAAQLAALAAIRGEEESWQATLEALGRFECPQIGPISAGTAHAVSGT